MAQTIKLEDDGMLVFEINGAKYPVDAWRMNNELADIGDTGENSTEYLDRQREIFARHGFPSEISDGLRTRIAAEVIRKVSELGKALPQLGSRESPGGTSSGPATSPSGL